MAEDGKDDLGVLPGEEQQVQQVCSKDDPYTASGLLQKEAYCYLNEVMRLGYERPLQVTDLYRAPDEVDSTMLTEELKASWEEERKKASPSLLRAIWNTFGWSYATYGIIGGVEWAAGIAEPFFVAELLAVLSEGDADTDLAWTYAGCFCACALVRSVLHHPFFFRSQYTGMKIRIATVGLIYEKVLYLSNRSLAGTTTGHLVNLISNDTERFDQALPFLHFLIIGPIKLAVIAYFLYLKLGSSSFIGVGLCVLLGPFQYLMGKLFRTLRSKSALLTDKRVKLMNEVITAIRLIKMYAWEKPFTSAVMEQRSEEGCQLRKTANVRAFNQGLFFVTSPLLMYLMLVVYVHATGNDLKASNVFPSVMYLNVLRLSISLFIPEAIKNGSEALVSIGRMQEYLLQEDFIPRHLVEEGSTTAVVFEGVTARWGVPHIKESHTKVNMEPEQEQGPVWENASFKVQRGELVGVVGAVGSGKSTLFSVILGELPAAEGRISLTSRPTYAAQEVWIGSDTVRSNITFGRRYDEKRYKKVVEACCLVDDFAQLEKGDLTVVGERGITLSGGQRARISLARACYQGGDIYLLDDPLSAVDSIVGKKLFDKCINGILKHKTRILVTHQHQFLPRCDRVLEVVSGTITEREGVKEHELFCPEAGVQSPQVSEYDAVQSPKIVVGEEKGADTKASNAITTEDRQVGAVTVRTYIDYFKHGGIGISLWFFVIGLAAQAMFVICDVWLARWTDRPEDDQDNGYRFRIYSLCVGAVVLLGFIRSFTFFNLALSASTSMHNSMFRAVLYSPVAFFDVNPSGRVLNRFSKDMGQMDELLPWIFFDCLQQVLLCTGAVVIVSIINPWVLIAVLPLLLIFLWIRRYFVATAREVRRLEANNRSPLYSAFSEAIVGLHTIRAFQRSSFFLKKYRAVQNDHSSAFFLFLACNRWLGLRLDLMAWFFISCVTVAAVAAKDSLSPGDVALSLTYATALAGSFQWCVRQSAETENNMTATERVRMYSTLPQQPPIVEGGKAVSVGPEWPAEGRIEFKGYSLKYREELPLVLKGVSLRVNAGEKVGVVGRTGAGKSSLMQALFRLVEPESGSIEIDGTDTTRVELDVLRSRCSVIPQDPVLFTGSLRYNLDPFSSAGDDRALWNALSSVEMEAVVQGLPGGLAYHVSEGGRNFSVGQRQLLCLARAVLRRNRILMMDEATANVDPATDAIIQRTVRERFEDCTVLTIAHRLHTVIDCDKILVLDQGEVEAFDDPHALLERGGNLLSKYVDETGPEESASLRKTAMTASLSRSAKFQNVPF